MVTAADVRELVDERPALEDAVEAVVDAEEPFTFDDLGIDSGAFGEIVSAGVVERSDDGYRVADRAAVRRGLAGETADGSTESGRGLSTPSLAIEPIHALALAGALSFVVLLRVVFSAGPVFHEGAVVLSGNDPYYYRYWVEQLLANPDLTLSSLPGTVTKGEPLYVATMWLVASLLGGEAVTGQLLAWYPVVSALVSAVLVYLVATEVTADRRVGIAAVLMFAVIAGHALRTSLGFADHHAFDYPWLGLTALSLVALVRGRLRSGRTALGTLGLAVGVAGQVLAWEAGPLLVIPVGLAVAALAVVWVRTDTSPLRAGLPILVGLAGASAGTWVVHTSLGWHTPVVASAPALLFAGSLGVLVVGELVARVRPDARVATGAILGTGLASVAGVAVLLPDAWNTLTSRADATLFRTDAIAETQGLFADSAGWLLLFGFVLFLALPYLVWATRRALDDDAWVVPVVYAWAFFALSAIQVRFVGEFATFISVFAGLGFVHLAERIDVARLPKPFDAGVDGSLLTRPSARQAGALAVLFLLVGGLGLVQVPIKTGQVTTPPAMYGTAEAMDAYTETANWSDRPEYVFSPWSHNRMYNYVVSGEARSYGYARANYESFLASTNESAWYERLRGRAGFVVYPTLDAPAGSIAERFDAYGSRTANASGLAKYRAVHVSPDGEYTAFTLVPGATVVGNATANTTLDLTASVTVSGTEFTYERRVEVPANGTYRVTVPYAATYEMGNRTVTVSDDAVETGETVTA